MSMPLRQNSPQPLASLVDRYYVWSLILTGLKGFRSVASIHPNFRSAQETSHNRIRYIQFFSLIFKLKSIQA